MSSQSATPRGHPNSQSAIDIVFVHGAGSSAGFWHWQREAFPNAHYLNLPGHGDNPQSATPGGHPNSQLDAFAGWVASYIEDAALSNVVLNGHSMGGAIALILALRRPTWLRALILTGTGAKLRVSPDLLDLLRTDYPQAVDFIVEKSFAHPDEPLTYAQKVRRNGTRKQLLRTPQQVTLADYESCDRFDLRERVGEISLLVLSIVGREDAMTPVKYSEYLHGAIEGLQLEVVEGAGHMLPLEKPDEYNDKVAAFLNKITTST